MFWGLCLCNICFLTSRAYYFIYLYFSFCTYYLSKFGAPFKRLSWIKEMDDSKHKKRKKIFCESIDAILETTWRLLNVSTLAIFYSLIYRK